MDSKNKPINKLRATAKGVAYTGVATHWNCVFGRVIIIAENTGALEIAGNKMEQLKAFQDFDPEICPEVAVFQMTDVEVA